MYFVSLKNFILNESSYVFYIEKKPNFHSIHIILLKYKPDTIVKLHKLYF